MNQEDFLIKYQDQFENVEGILELLKLIKNDMYLIFLGRESHYTTKYPDCSDIVFNRHELNENAIAHEILHGIYFFNDFKSPEEIFRDHINGKILQKVFSYDDISRITNDLLHIHFKPKYLQLKFKENQFVENPEYQVDEKTVNELANNYEPSNGFDISNFITTYIDLVNTNNEKRDVIYATFKQHLQTLDPELYDKLDNFIEAWSSHEDISTLMGVLEVFFKELSIVAKDRGVN